MNVHDAPHRRLGTLLYYCGSNWFIATVILEGHGPRETISRRESRVTEYPLPCAARRETAKGTP